MKITRRDIVKGAGCGCLGLSMGLLYGLPGMAETLQPAPSAKGRKEVIGDSLQVLPPHAVQLDGYLQRYIQLAIERWTKQVVPYKALADFYRSGRPQISYEGRALELFATGEMWGKAVRSAALFYRYTGDPQLKSLLKGTVADVLSMRRSNGTISCTPVEKQPGGPDGDIWERTYVLLGLDDYYEFVERDPAVLQAMIDEADATLNQVGPPPKKRIVDLGWSRGGVNGNNVESSTILEPIVRLYKRTGYVRYLEFARYIVEAEGGSLHHRLFDEVLSGEDLVAIGGVYPKAYETTSLFEGLTEYYRVTGNPRWKDAALQYFHKVIEKELTIIGNGGGDQPYHANVQGEAWDNTALEQTNPDIKRMMETCTGVTWLKYCSQILRLTGDPLTVDYIELYAYNGLIGAMKPQGDGFSYVNLLNGVKTNKLGWGTDISGVYVTCCNLNGPIGLAFLPLVAVMRDAAGPVINLYNAGKCAVPIAAGNTLALKIDTRYPLDGHVRIEVALNTPQSFAIKLRIPAWSKQTSLKVNDQNFAADTGRYATIEREWKSGDVIELNLEMLTRLIEAPHGLHEGSDKFRALVRGPIVLARDENIDARFNEAVDVVETNGVVDAKAVKPTLAATNMQFEVPTRGGTIQMVDYASVNSWDGKRVQTWLPVIQHKS